MEPIQLSTQKPAATVPKRSPGLIVNVAGHKITTHSLAAGLGLLIAVVGPTVAEKWPQAAPAIDAARDIIQRIEPLPLPLQDPTPPPPEMGPYEKRLRTAWDAEKDAAKRDQLKRMIYLYRRTLFEAENKWSDLAELSKSCHDEADKLGLTGQLLILRGVITTEWNAQITDKAPAPITELMRADISGFLRDTLEILGRLP